MSWVTTKQRFAGYYHVIPVDDLKPHALSASCWCKPDVPEDEELLLIHNSMDRRELYESGQLNLQ